MRLPNRVIPHLLLDKGGLYKTVQFRRPTYVGDCINTVRLFNDLEVDELIISDIKATKSRVGPDYALIEEIASEAFIPLCYGGGISTFEQAKMAFDCGIEKVSLNSAIFANPDLVQEIASRYGSQSVIASVDVKRGLLGKYQVYSHAGKKAPVKDPVKWCTFLASLGAGEILLNSVDREGTWTGYDLELIATISAQLSIPLIAEGGARDVSDLVSVVTNGNASAVAAASMFVFQGQKNGVLINFPRKEIDSGFQDTFKEPTP